MEAKEEDSDDTRAAILRAVGIRSGNSWEEWLRAETRTRDLAAGEPNSDRGLTSTFLEIAGLGEFKDRSGALASARLSWVGCQAAISSPEIRLPFVLSKSGAAEKRWFATFSWIRANSRIAISAAGKQDLEGRSTL
jgi:hypothetical protein